MKVAETNQNSVSNRGISWKDTDESRCTRNGRKARLWEDQEAEHVWGSHQQETLVPPSRMGQRYGLAMSDTQVPMSLRLKFQISKLNVLVWV